MNRDSKLDRARRVPYGLAAAAGCLVQSLGCMLLLEDPPSSGESQDEVLADSRQGEACTDEEPSCVDAFSIDVCEEGTVQDYDCDEVCAPSGRASSDCTGSQCVCDQTTDQLCEDAVSGVCFCLEWAEQPACIESDLADKYRSCYEDGDAVLICFGQQVSDGTINCAAAAQTCL